MSQLRHWISDRLSPRLRSRIIGVESQILHPFYARSGLARLVRRRRLAHHLKRPEEVDIEITSGCDADCIMCPRKAMRRRAGPMDMALFRKIVDEAVALDVRGLHLNGYGEISTLKNYRDYVDYIRRASRGIRILINTNGMRMNEGMARYYVEAGVNIINITIDGATAATFEKVRRHLRLDQVEQNVRRLIEIRNRSRRRYPLIRVQMLALPENQHETAQFLAKWDGLPDELAVMGAVNRVGSVPYGQVEDDWEQTPCWLLWNQMPVLSDGTVALCCDDWDGEAPQGNLNDTSIREIWTSVQRRRLRALHLEGRGVEIPICAGCQQPRQGPWWFGTIPAPGANEIHISGP